MPRPKKQPIEETVSEMTMPSESTASTGGPPADNGDKEPNKTEKVRQAMEQGRKRKPLSIKEWIEAKWPGTEIDTGHISTIKSTLRKQGGVKKPRKAAAEGGDAPAPGRRNGNADSLSVDEIRVVRGLMNRIGRDRFREVIDLLS
jgi:hypothetical protein